MREGALIKSSFFNKPEIPEQESPIWICSQEGICKVWIRENFTFEKIPICPVCGSNMVHGIKVLPVLKNES
ncbi:cold-inducible protein YdjO-related protein [Cohnella sp.]|uniref:cold-inducible protein YdjO-related protein n=1 Tax=Cohnella sp. TaxID=1883426 RepID=UPI003562BBF7